MENAGIHGDAFTVLGADLKFKSLLSGALFHHICSESDAESGILPVLALNQMTYFNLMEALLSKQTQYTPSLWDPLHTKKK